MSQQTHSQKRAQARTPEVRPEHGQTLLAFALLLTATLLFYGSVGKLLFVTYDDPWYVTANSHVAAGLSWENLGYAFTTLDAGNWHPLTWISHMIDCELFGLDPAGHHYDSLLFHSLNVLLLFWILLKATGHRWRSFCASALFALHPLNVQNVAWISERKSLVSALFMFLAFLSYGWYVRNPNWKRYLTLAGCFAASLLSKPMAVSFPFALLLLDYWPLGRLPDPAECRISGGDGARPGWWNRLGKLTLEKLPLFAMAAASSWITIVAQKGSNAMQLNSQVPFVSRLANAVYSYFEYVRILFWPARLSVFYPFPVLAAWKVVLSALFLAAITVLVLIYRRRKYLVFGWFWFLGMLVPVIGLLQVGKQAMADRYCYIPLLGLFVILVWLAAEAIQTMHLPHPATIAVAACVLLAAGVTTRMNLEYWQNSGTLWAHARQVASRPDVMIQTNLGETLARDGQMDQAMQELRIGEQLDPQNAEIHGDIGAVLLEGNQLPEAEAEFQTVVRDAGHELEFTLGAYSELGRIHQRQARLDEAWSDYTEILKINPQSYPALMGRGQVRLRQGRNAEAEEEVRRAIAIQSTPEAWDLLGTVLDRRGDRAQAAQAYEQSHQLQRR